MKTTLLLSSLILFMTLASCGPASENREMMHQRAKVFQDSIANIIRTSMAEAEGTNQNVIMMPAPSQTPAANPAQ